MLTNDDKTALNALAAARTGGLSGDRLPTPAKSVAVHAWRRELLLVSHGLIPGLRSNQDAVRYLTWLLDTNLTLMQEWLAGTISAEQSEMRASKTLVWHTCCYLRDVDRLAAEDRIRDAWADLVVNGTLTDSGRPPTGESRADTTGEGS